MLDLVLDQAINGLVLGSVYVLIAVGLSVIFGLLGIVNFAHGAFFALGAHFTVSLQAQFGWWSVVVAPFAVALVGALVEVTLIRRLYGREPLTVIVLTSAPALFIEAAPLLLKQYADFGMKDGAPISTATDIVNAGAQASGIYGKVWHYEEPKNSEADNAFTKAYIAKMGRPPHANSFLAAVSMRLIRAGIEKAGSTPAGAIVRALEGMRIEDGDFPIFFREWDHQLMHRTAVLKVRPQYTDPWKALEVVESAPDAPYGRRADSACAIGDL